MNPPDEREIPAPGLYVHVPFCRGRKCAYCAFASVPHTAARAAAYLDALAREGDARADGRAFATAYIGGGTPTALAPEALARLLALVGRWRGGGAGEWTVEANPGTLGDATLERLLAAGVNRISLGVQTFHPDGHAALGRAGSPEAARAAIRRLARAEGLRWSLDLISGWPGQTDTDWEGDLREAAASGAEHVSVYALQVEPDTPLAARPGLAPPDDEAERRHWDRADAVLGAAGLHRYEMGNFARPGAEARHNLTYWRGGDYVGLGPSAHSHWRGRRFANVTSPAEYAARLRAAPAVAAGEDPPEGWGAEVFSERLAPAAKAREAFAFGLRLRDGVHAATFAARFGVTPEELYGATLADWLARGGLVAGAGRIRLADAYYPVADLVLADLV